MAKIRVYELARDLGVESKVLLVKMKELKIEVSSHQSTLSSAQIDKIKSSFSVGKAPVVVRRRKKTEEEEPAEVQQDKSHVPTSTHPSDEKKSSKSITKEIHVVEEVEPLSVAQEPQEELKELPTKQDESVSFSPESEELASTLSKNSVEEEVEKAQVENQKEELLEDKPLDTENPTADNVVVTQEETPVSGEEEKMGVTMKADKMGLSKKSEFVSATIIRRATPEEEVAFAKSKEDKRAKIKRIEVPVQPIRTISSVAPPVKDWKEPFKIVPEPILKSDRGVERKKDGFKSRVVEEEERPPVKPVQAGPKRRSVSTRELLEAVSRADDDVDVIPAILGVEAPRRKTIYTPSASRKKKEAKKRKDLKSTQLTTPRAAYRVVKMNSQNIVVSELASQLHVKVGELVKTFMGLGLMVTANQSIDFDSATLAASEFGFEVKRITRTVEDILEWSKEDQYEKVPRPPIVTVMGHVDHGKTTILDAIRKADVANREAGGITQHIGAYTVESHGFKTAFLDTPGHAAFSAMRGRGAQITDIVVLVVAADDGVMPQTKEAIEHAKKAGVPIVVALNKIDKPNLNFDRIYTELSELGIQAEEWGGDVQCVKVSAKKMMGIEELLEAIQVQYEILELKARVKGRAKGVVVEAHRDKGRGSIATMMVTEGNLNVGDFIVVGKVFGRVRAMIDHNGKALKEATPSTPVGIIGLTELPMAGDIMHVVKDEKSAREVIDLRITEEREAIQAAKVPPTLEDLMNRTAESLIPQLLLIIKADTQGSAQAIAHAIAELNSKMIRPEIIYRGVGDLNEGDLTLADTSKAAIIAFNVKVSRALLERAESSGISIKSFSIIYELLDSIKDLMVKKLPPILNEVVQGHAEVRNTISVPKIGLVAGSAVTDGKITRNSMLRVLRNSDVVYSGKLLSLKRFKDDVKEVLSGFECGIAIDGYKDVQVGDVIEAYMIEEKPAVLDI